MFELKPQEVIIRHVEKPLSGLKRLVCPHCLLSVLLLTSFRMVQWRKRDPQAPCCNANTAKEGKQQKKKWYFQENYNWHCNMSAPWHYGKFCLKSTSVVVTPEGRPGMSDVFPPVWNLRAVIWFHFAISSLVLLPSPVTLSVLLFSACWPFTKLFPENSSIFFVKR